jgi:hypothetical protein
VPGSPGEAVLLAASAGGALSRLRLRLPHSAAGESLGDAEVRRAARTTLMMTWQRVR